MTILQTLDEAAAHLSGERVLSRVEREELADFVVEARAAVAELVEAAKGMRAVTGGGNVCTVTESLAAYHRLDAALAPFGGAA